MFGPNVGNLSFLLLEIENKLRLTDGSVLGLLDHFSSQLHSIRWAVDVNSSYNCVTQKLDRVSVFESYFCFFDPKLIDIHLLRIRSRLCNNHIASEQYILNSQVGHSNDNIK